MKKKTKKNELFLAKTAIDESFFKNYYKYYLGYFCITQNSNLNNFNEKNVLNYHWKSKQKILKKYNYFYRISNKLLTRLTYNLNLIHNRTENEDYWRIIIFPWICSYVITLYDRWEIVTHLKKKTTFLFLHLNMMARKKHLKFQI